ncbi:MAG TPA: hypothetical protein VLW53_18260, partial [Candidatus Eisenbacteria bacterium]|nr:hypothetical protein [Candidatus Eisenbacteria bacterium]
MDTRHDEPHLRWRDLEVKRQPARAPHAHRRPDARSLVLLTGRQPDPTQAFALPDLRRRLLEWEETAADPVAAYHGRALPAYLNALQQLLARQVERSGAALLAALAVGPRSGGLPGAGDIGGLVELACRSRADALDLAVAWGCGWRRPIR